MKTTHCLKQAALLITGLMLSATLVSAQSKGSGNVVKQDRDLPEFTRIEAGSAFSIKISQGETQMVTVETDDNLQGNITTRVTNGILRFSSEGLKNPTAMRIWIVVPLIEEISTNGAARIETNGAINTPSLNILASGASKIDIEVVADMLTSEISGASKVIISGSATKHNTEVSGASKLDALKLNTSITEAEISGAAKANVYAKDQITAELSGAGTLYYYDNGSLKKINSPGTVTISPQNSSIPADIETDNDIDIIGQNDSTIINIGDLKVQVYEGDPTRITIGGNELEVDDDGKVKFKRNRHSKFDGHFGGFEMGVNGYVNSNGAFDMPEGYEFLDLRMEKSINVKLNFFEQNFNLISNKFGLTTGLGFEWRNYRFKDDVVLLAGDNDIFNNFENEPLNYTKSKLLVNYLNLPLLLEYQTNHQSKKNSFHIGAGVQAGLRIGSHTKNIYQENGKKNKDKNRDDFYLNPFKYDAMLRLGWGKLNLYADYSLNTLFKNNRGPELYPFSAGITLVGW